MVTYLCPLSRVIGHSGRHAPSTWWRRAKHLLDCVQWECIFIHLQYLYVYQPKCLCTSMHWVMFIFVYLEESTYTVMMELILIGMRLGSCYHMLAVVLLLRYVLWTFLLQRDSWPSNMIQTTNYPLTTSQPSQSPENVADLDLLKAQIHKKIFLHTCSEYCT